jgi:hypothetical protein
MELALDDRLPAFACGPGSPRTDPDFLHATLDRSAYAAFFTESRMRLLGSIKLHRKSGYRPGAFSAVPFDKLRAGSAGLVAVGMYTQDLRPGLLSAVPSGLVPIRRDR